MQYMQKLLKEMAAYVIGNLIHNSIYLILATGT